MVSDKETNRFGFSVLKDSVSLLKTMDQTVDLIATSNYTSQIEVINTSTVFIYLSTLQVSIVSTKTELGNFT